MMDFKDIPMFLRAHYEVDVEWRDLEGALARYTASYGLDLDPIFQRAHVWTRVQQIAYVEFVLRGGEVAKNLTFNCKGWNGGGDTGPLVIIDGKQRLEAARAFLRDAIPVFGHLRSQITGHMRFHAAGFKFRIASLATDEEVYRLYLGINGGGTPHTAAELGKVRELLAALRK